MGLSAAQVLEVRTTGVDTNSGGFKTGASGTDWSQQDAAQYSVTDGVTAGTTTITSATANFGTDVVGNLIYVQGGTGSVTAGWYEITARTNSTTITVDRSTGLTTGTGVTLKIGGALLTMGTASGIAIAGNTVWVKAGSGYTISTGVTWSNSNGGTSTVLTVSGYTTTRGDNGKPSITVGANSITVMTTGASTLIQNFAIVNGGAKTSVTGFSVVGNNGAGGVYNCTADSVVTGFLATNRGCAIHSCYASNCTRGFTLQTAVAILCVASACTTGFTDNGNGNDGVTCISCIATGGTTGFAGGAGSSGTTLTLWGCIGYNQGGAAVSITGGGFTGVAAISNCIFEKYTTFGITSTTSIALLGPGNNAFHSSVGGSAARNNITTGSGDVTLTGDPFTNASGGDFSLNNTASAGAACRATGIPGVFPGVSTTGYQDIGVQHQASGGGILVPTSMDGAGQ